MCTHARMCTHVFPDVSEEAKSYPLRLVGLLQMLKVVPPLYLLLLGHSNNTMSWHWCIHPVDVHIDSNTSVFRNSRFSSAV